ncbi:hypothetical protein [uncultured Gilvimarinus sp.]|uniref:hypothetical protein n=1 Tax=uncultured Gilvimarinus sp. TaxID=1689143 RepID=UPI0030EE0F30
MLRPYPGYMLAWVAISGDHKSRIGLNAYFEELERLAIIAGSPALQFWTVRRGFSRICKQRGYHSRQSEWHGVPITIWEKSL